MRDFVKALTSFSWALSVFGTSQAGKILRGLPTDAPTQRANAGFRAATDAIRHQLDSLENRVYKTGNAVQGIFVDLFFDLLKPENYDPQVIAETTRNVFNAGLGLAAQFIPGGRFLRGGPPQGWGPVNVESAELFYSKPATFEEEEVEASHAEALADHEARPTGGYEHLT
jgi:hypothetical protein